MNRFSLSELFIPKEGGELRLIENNSIQVVGYVKNPLPGPATIVLLLIQPNQCPIMESVNVEIPETKKGRKGNPFFSVKEGDDAFPTKITIKIIREYSDGILSSDVLMINEGV